MKSDILSIKTTEELKKAGSPDKIKTLLQADLPPFIAIKTQTDEELLQAIEWVYEYHIREEQVFISERARVIFCLTEIDGENRTEQLGFLDHFYTQSGRTEAKRWRNKISHILRADLYHDEKTRLAFENLKALLEQVNIPMDDFDTVENISGEQAAAELEKGE